MKTNKRIVLLIILFINLVPVKAQDKEISSKDTMILKGDYYGQKTPDNTPILFAPEIMNAEMGYHSPIIFSPDLTEAYWSPMDTMPCMMFSKRIDGVWSTPVKIDFGLKMGAGDPAFSHNGEKLYFLSFQPPKPGDTERERIWFVVRKDEGWSEPKPIDEIILKHPTHWTFSFAANGNLYFTSEITGVRGEQDIYFAQFDGEKYLEPIDLGEMINTDGKELSPCIAPDESFIIFTRVGDGTKKADLYVSFKKDDGNWTKAIEIGSSINSEKNDLCASLSPDGNYLFFLSQREGLCRIYWVSSKIIEEIKQKSLMD
jgi:hypothetical protein